MKVGKSKKSNYWKAQGGALVGGYKSQLPPMSVPGMSPSTSALLNAGLGVAGAAAGGPGAIALQLALQGGKALYGAYQTKQAQKGLAELEKTRPATSVGEYAEIAKRAVDSSALRAIQERSDAALATSLEALKYSPRGASQVGSVLRQSQDVALQQALAQEQMGLQALQGVAGAEERRLGREEARYQQALTQQQQLAGAGAANIAQAIGGAGEDIFKQQYLKQLQQQPFMAKEGGMMTGGKFSHKTNPIDIVQKGKKVGEMTGGEVILNPEQQKAVASQSPYFRSLLKKFNKKK